LQLGYYWRIVSFFGIRQNGHGVVIETCDPCHAHAGVGGSAKVVRSCMPGQTSRVRVVGNLQSTRDSGAAAGQHAGKRAVNTHATVTQTASSTQPASEQHAADMQAARRQQIKAQTARPTRRSITTGIGFSRPSGFKPFGEAT
jgi:hypothetical protein